MATVSAATDASTSIPLATEALRGTNVLLTGGAGFIGQSILARLADPNVPVARALTIIRGDDPLSRLAEVLHEHAVVAKEGDDLGALDKRIIILRGDCSKPGLGMPGKQAAWLAKNVDIVIHAAGDTRFFLPQDEALAAISDLGYAMAKWSAISHVKTHIHLSTCFIGWFLPHGSVVKEELRPLVSPDLEHEKHPNTYIHAKTICESVINSFAMHQAGQATPKTTWRVVRISTVGPAANYPYPGFGAGSASSPICSGIAADVLPEEALLKDGVVDTVPVDVAADQILCLSASAHNSAVTRRNPKINANVPIYHVAAGLEQAANLELGTLNDPSTKLVKPMVSARSMIRCYGNMIQKRVGFDVTLASRVLSLQLGPAAVVAPIASSKSATATAIVEKHAGADIDSDANILLDSVDIHGDVHDFDDEAVANDKDPLTRLARAMLTVGGALGSMVVKVITFDSKTLGMRGLTVETRPQVKPAAPSTVVASPAHVDVPMDTAGFDVDIKQAVAKAGGWTKYLQTARDRMEELIAAEAAAEAASYVD